MTSDDFPEEVTKDNIANLTEKAEGIIEKSLKRTYFLVILIFIFVSAVVLTTGTLSLFSWLSANRYLDFLLRFSPILQVIVFFALLFTVMLIVSYVTVHPLLFSLRWLFRRYFGYPKIEERIFADCFIIAKHLSEGERLKAKEEIDLFLGHLGEFLKDWFNEKRTAYRPEFNLLRSGANEICRMLLFSKEEVPEILMRFGLAFARDDHPTAFFHLQRLVEKVQEYGELGGRFHRLIGRIERHPKSFTLILAIIYFVVSLLFTILGYTPPSPPT